MPRLHHHPTWEDHDWGLCSFIFSQNSSLLGHPFPTSVSPVFTHLQRAQLLGGAQVKPWTLCPPAP